MNRSAILLIVIGLLPSWGKSAPKDACPTLKNATPQTLLSYLQKDRSTLNPKCIQTAIDKLGDLQYLPAIPTLIQYLDFKKPMPKGLPLQVDHPEPSNGLYPAAVALDNFQKLAIPDVKKAIQDDSKNPTQRSVAAELYEGWLTEDAPASIRFIVQASKASKDQEAAGELLDLATKVAERCGPTAEQQKQCYEALYGK